jgi:hypothetical protein
MNGLIPGVVVKVTGEGAKNYGLAGRVVLPSRLARDIPPGWVWVEFSAPDGRWRCEYPPVALTIAKDNRLTGGDE